MPIQAIGVPVMQRTRYVSPNPPSEVWTRRSTNCTIRYTTYPVSAAIRRKRPSPLTLYPTGWSRSSSGWNSEISSKMRSALRQLGVLIENQWSISDYVTPNAVNLLSNEPVDDIILQNRAVAKVKGAGVNLANMLGEYRQSASMFASLSVDVARITLAVLQRNPGLLRPKREWSSTLARRHLEYVYGVSPFVQDMHGAVVALRNRLNGPSPVFLPISEGKTTRRFELSNKVADGPEFDFSGRLTPILRNAYCIRKTRLKGTYVLRNTELLAALGQYGLTNPLATAWELLPFSFVADWWVNVGEVLDSLDAILYIDAGRSVGTISRLDSGKTTFTCYDATASGWYRNYSRQVVALPTMAQLRYKPSPSAQHIANGLALFRTGAFTNFNLPWRKT